MKQDVIDAVAAAGFDVYMRALTDTWLIFTDPATGRIGYLQAPRGDGYSLSTVHMPNTTTGTGFQVDRYLTDFSRQSLQRAFLAPDWASGRDRESVRKYRDIEHFRAANEWNGAYRLAAKGAR
jgi:hypothetical protein